MKSELLVIARLELLCKNQLLLLLLLHDKLPRRIGGLACLRCGIRFPCSKHLC
jgi:hypothetical protein